MNILEIKKNVSVGQTVWLVPEERQGRRSKEPVPYLVAKIGRKYLEVKKEGMENWDGIKFDMTDDFKQYNNGYSPDWVVYFSLQEILDEQESLRLANNIRSYIGTWGIPKLTLYQLQAINQIVENK